MKKLYFLLLVGVVFFSKPLQAQWVTIPDANFVLWLHQNHPTCMNGNQMDTTCSSILNATYIYMGGPIDPDIQNFSGIEYFTNLQDLNCQNIALQNLPELPPNLISLNLSNNFLQSLPSLPSSLVTLSCAYNNLSSLPAIPAGLLNLNVDYNSLTYLPELPDSMAALYFNSNAISCINNLPNHVDTFLLGFSGNPFTCVPNQTFYTFGYPLCIDGDPLNNPDNCFSMANVSGMVFDDNNGDCVFNSGDSVADNLSVGLYDASNQLISLTYTSNGVYGFNVNQVGDYSVKINTSSSPISMTCGSDDSLFVSLPTPGSVVSQLHFPVECNQPFDVYVQGVSTIGWVFPGQTHRMKTRITTNELLSNLSCNSVNTSGQVSITVSGPVSYSGSGPGALIPNVNGNVFTYTISDFNNLNPNSFGLFFQTDTTAQSGDQICVHVEIDPAPLDADTLNNVYDFCYQVVNSYDPNMKEVYPVDVLPGYNDWFTYTIHFQNTGTAPAFNIRLRDTLDTNLDLSTFEVMSYSHPAVVHMSGNQLVVRFNNIMLPDSTSDYEGSMGYFQYRIKPLPNLPVGTQIENTAYIYFDYNAPIITNTTQNNFDITVAVAETMAGNEKFEVFPNPATNMITIRSKTHVQSVEIFNTVGEKLMQINSGHQINIEALPAGLYLLRINGTQVCRIAKR